ncbi:MAG: LysM peptidoglycan-binding domain-containing protein [Alphaproteobacteria bacterium]|nr:LysM peptidoglycan-binding domain-containing protein [Alphaproteobacteria bacterium]
MGKLAEKFHCTVEDICKWNDIKNPDQIQVDQKLIFKF